MTAQSTRTRQAAIDIQPEAFRALGYQLIDLITEFMAALPNIVVTMGRQLDRQLRPDHLR